MTLEKTRSETSPPDVEPGKEEQPAKKSPALNIPGLLAGAATAATMSVLGGHLSVVGTVLGAALTSIVSGVAIVVYSTSLEKSRHGLKKVHTTLAQRVFVRPGPDASASEGSTTVVGGSRWSALRPRLKPALVSAGAILGLAVAAIFGIQALTGTELSGGTGTIQRTVTGSESVAVRSVDTPAPDEQLVPDTTEGLDPAQEAPADAPTPVDGVPVEEAPEGGAAAGDGTAGEGTAPYELPGTDSQQLDSGQTGTDGGVADPGAPAQPGAAGAGAVPAAP